MAGVKTEQADHGRLLTRVDDLHINLSDVDSVLNGTYGSSIGEAAAKDEVMAQPLEDGLVTLIEQIDKAIERVQGLRERLLQITRRL